MAKYTTLDQIDVPAVADLYGLDQPELTPLKGGAANSSFHLVSAADEYVLTILDNHDASSADRLAAHTQALFSQGIPTSEVVPTVDGALVSHLNDCPVVLKRWIAGEVEQPLPVELLPQAGRALAQLHALSPRTPGLGDIPVGTRRLSRPQKALISDFADRDFAEWLIDRLKRVHIGEAGAQRASTVTHGDLFDDNIIVRGDRTIAVLDWETISLDDPLLDLGMAAVGLARVDGLLVADRLQALVDGYRQAIPLSDEDMAGLTIEIAHAGLIIAFHRYYRHSVRYPDPTMSSYHSEMVGFVDSVGGAVKDLN